MPESVAAFPRYDDDTEEQKNPSRKKSNNEDTKDVGGVAGARLRSIIERVENLETEKKALTDDIKEIYAEAKGVGFDIKIIRKIVSLRKKDAEKRREEEELLDLYKSAIGMY